MQADSMNVPEALKNWFTVHFFADVIFAIPLFLFPESFLKFLEWKTIDPITTRMVAAALFGIGIESLLCRNASLEVFKAMLNLKIIWSFCAIIGLTIAIISGFFGITLVGFSILVTFILFNFLWIYWRYKLSK